MRRVFRFLNILLISSLIRLSHGILSSFNEFLEYGFNDISLTIRKNVTDIILFLSFILMNVVLLYFGRLGIILNVPETCPFNSLSMTEYLLLLILSCSMSFAVLLGGIVATICVGVAVLFLIGTLIASFEWIRNAWRNSGVWNETNKYR